MIHIESAGNTEIPCFLALKEPGYRVSREITGNTETWTAEKSGLRMVSDDGLVSLLGLAKLIEMRGKSWKAVDEEIDRFIARFCKTD